MFGRQIFALLGVCALLFCCEKENASPKKERSIVVVYENDVHCQGDGYAKFAAVRDAVRDTADVLTVSSGDFLQGGAFCSMTKGASVVALMNAVGYDAVALGNHEFDYKIPRLLEVAGSLKAPVVCSNFERENLPVFSPSVLKRVGDKTVAFVGVLTPHTEFAESYAFHDTLLRKFYRVPAKGLAQKVQSAVDAARRDGADYVLLLSHLGMEPPAISVDLIRNTTGIHAVLDGHSHSVIQERFAQNKTGDSVLLSQTGSHFKNVGLLDISPEGIFHSRLLPLDSVKSASEKVSAVYDSILADASRRWDGKIAYADFALMIEDSGGNRAVRNAETNLGDFVADAMRFATGAQIALVNGGAIRKSIPAGSVRYRDVLDAMPFENEMLLIRARGGEILGAIREGLSKWPAEFGGFLQVSGLRIFLSVGDSLRLERAEVEQDGAFVALDSAAFYTVGLSSYVAYAGEEIVSFRQSERMPCRILTDTEAVEGFMENLGGKIPDVYRAPQGRILFQRMR
ncbi:bifunctional metallophosphatase/5'-nucleotidase [Fibrobacter intestinalis]|uniref:2',3'-cyclic-nucleotide 2'-phosphodiesterase/5'-or 3'-nucleotidase, 5'-nucleotidase family n=1 Tax=Fibrobacter intestinalis TaxID=28122 RepID=A0A1T4QNL5_9BACT|nr:MULTISPECIES: bifunctional UDP-sugar hydrolase/5'-nucleotidase [Fibrobacter]PBC72839.1 2',3'-cyclic-nucleotide 2'-phosphodiesterase (5'-nucleotidase family) [Fibrobacter sp. NR9]SKA05285.1 2',3'-cyclic-nucleotide 2'-phosphodiesterase/5'-or 3'-nucleotidase, 5'-nucleotidase family [Fibrobacter intestinalis]